LYTLVGQTSEPLFVEEPCSSIEVEINTPIALLWRIEYDEECSHGCLQVSLNTSNGHGLYNFPAESNHEIRSNLLFDAATTIIPSGPNSTSTIANVHVIMFIDEFVRNNVPFLYCKAVVSTLTDPSDSIVYISVTDLPTTIPNTQPCNSTHNISVTDQTVPPDISTTTECDSAHNIIMSRINEVHFGILVIGLSFFHKIML
jgi:hypothetical protein